MSSCTERATPAQWAAGGRRRERGKPRLPGARRARDQERCDDPRTL